MAQTTCLTVSEKPLIAGTALQPGSQEDMPQLVQCQSVEIVFRKIQFEAAFFEVQDFTFDLISAHLGNGTSHAIMIGIYCCHNLSSFIELTQHHQLTTVTNALLFYRLATWADIGN